MISGPHRIAIALATLGLAAASCSSPTEAGPSPDPGYIANNASAEAQDAAICIAGPGRVLGALAVGTTAVESSKLTVAGAPNLAGAGTVSGSAGGNTLVGSGSAFLAQASAGDLLVVADQTYSVAGVASNSELTLSAPLSADVLSAAYTLQKSLLRLQTADGSPAISVDASGRIGVGTVTPAAALDIRGNVLGADLDCYTTGWGDATGCAIWPEPVPPACDAGYVFTGIATFTQSDSGCGQSAITRAQVKSRCCRVR